MSNTKVILFTKSKSKAEHFLNATKDGFENLIVPDPLQLQQKTFDAKPSFVLVDLERKEDMNLSGYLKMLSILPDARRPILFVATSAQLETLGLNEKTKPLVHEWFRSEKPFEDMVEKLVQSRKALLENQKNQKRSDQLEFGNSLPTQLFEILNFFVKTNSFQEIIKDGLEQAHSHSMATNLQIIYLGKHHEDKGICLSTTQPANLPPFHFNLDPYPEISSTYRSGRPLLIDQVDSEKKLRYFKELGDRAAFTSLLILPLQVRGKPFGIVLARFEDHLKTLGDPRAKALKLFCSLMELRLQSPIDVTGSMVFLDQAS